MVPVVSRKIKFSPGRKKSPWIIPVVSKKYINGPSVQFRLIFGVKSDHVQGTRGLFGLFTRFFSLSFSCSLFLIRRCIPTSYPSPVCSVPSHPSDWFPPLSSSMSLFAPSRRIHPFTQCFIRNRPKWDNSTSDSVGFTVISVHTRPYLISA